MNVLKHKKVLTIADGPDTTRVRPSNWNEEHIFAGGSTDGDVLVWKGAESDKAAFRPLVPAGTRAIFDQDTAPLGWTRDTDATLNDRLIRLVSGSRGPNGGSWTVTGLTTDQQGAHTHTLSGHTHSMQGHTHGIAEGGTHTHTFTNSGPSSVHYAGGPEFEFAFGDHTHSGTTSADGSHAHGGATGAPNVGNTGTPSTDQTSTAGQHNHSVGSDGSWRPLHRDMIVCVKADY